MRPGPVGTRREALHLLVQDAGRRGIRVFAYVPGRLVVLTAPLQPNPVVTIVVMADYPMSLATAPDDPGEIAAWREIFEARALYTTDRRRFVAYACDQASLDEWLAEQGAGAEGALTQSERIRL